MGTHDDNNPETFSTRADSPTSVPVETEIGQRKMTDERLLSFLEPVAESGAPAEDAPASAARLPGVFPQRKDWMDGSPYLVTEADMSKPWSGFRDGRCFRCHMCGVFFKPGDTIRLIWCNGVKEARDAGVNCGNVHVCAACDGVDIYTRLAEHERIGNERYWHLGDAERLPRNPHSPPARRPRP